MEQPTDSPKPSSTEISQPRLRDRFKAEIRRRGYSRRTEKAYWFWIRWFILHSGTRHPRDLGAREVEGFLSWLATERNVAAATQNQALAAPFVRDTLAGSGARHPHGAGAPRPRGRVDDDDLHACAEQGRPRREEPSRSSRAAEGRICSPLSASRQRSF